MFARKFNVETALYRSVRTAIAADSQLSEEYRLATRVRRPPMLEWILKCVAIGIGVPSMLVGLPLVLIVGFELFWGVDMLLAATAALTTLASCITAIHFRARLEQSRTISVLSHLPSTDSEIVRRVMRELLPSCALIVGYFTEFVFGSIAWRHGFGVGEWAFTLALPLIQGMSCVAVSIVLVRFVQPPFIMALCAVLIAAPLAYLYVGAPEADTVSMAVYCTFPSGWVNALIGQAVLKRVAIAWMAVSGIVAMIAAGVLAWNCLRRTFAIHEFVIEPDAEISTTLFEPFDGKDSLAMRLSARLGTSKEHPFHGRRLKAADAEILIRSGTFLQHAPPPRSQCTERIIDSMLTARQRVILELLTANKTHWTMSIRGLMTILILLLICNGPPAWLPVSTILLYVSMYLVSETLTGPWLGFRSQACGGSYTPRFAVWPIGFDEISRVMLKVGLIRGLLTLPPFLALMALTTPAPNLDLPLPIVLAIGGTWVLLVAQGWLLVWGLTLVMRFPAVRLRIIVWHFLKVVLVIGGCLGIALAFVSLKAPGQWHLDLAAAGMLLGLGCPFGYWYQLRSMNRRGLLDFVRNKRTSAEEHIVDLDRRQSQQRARYQKWFGRPAKASGHPNRIQATD